MTKSSSIQDAFSKIESQKVLLELIISLKEEGANQEAVVRELTVHVARLRDLGEEQKEDESLEILDRVVGWCNPSLRLFPEQ